MSVGSQELRRRPAQLRRPARVRSSICQQTSPSPAVVPPTLQELEREYPSALKAQSMMDKGRASELVPMSTREAAEARSNASSRLDGRRRIR